VQRKTIDRLQNNIQQWRTKVMQLQRETDERTRVLKEEKATIQKHYQQKALETEQEQILPFQAMLSPGEEGQLETQELPNELIQIDKTRLPHQSTLLTSTGEIVPPVERLRKFYQRMNRVTVDKAILEKERDRLAAENAQLQDMIRQYQEGLTINPELLKTDNPLLVVNGRASLNRPLHFPKQPDQIFKQEVMNAFWGDRASFDSQYLTTALTLQQAAHTIQYSESLMP
jgi:hypothetical protein